MSLDDIFNEASEVVSKPAAGEEYLPILTPYTVRVDGLDQEYVPRPPHSRLKDEDDTGTYGCVDFVDDFEETSTREKPTHFYTGWFKATKSKFKRKSKYYNSSKLEEPSYEEEDSTDRYAPPPSKLEIKTKKGWMIDANGKSHYELNLKRAAYMGGGTITIVTGLVVAGEATYWPALLVTSLLTLCGVYSGKYIGRSMDKKHNKGSA